MDNKILLYILCFLMIATLASAADYTIGSDGGDDYATWDAFKDAVPSPATGSNVTLRKGETHVMHSTRTQILIDWTGTVGDRVVIGAHGTGADPIIDGQDLYPDGPCDGTDCWKGLVASDGADYLTLENLDIRNAEGAGILLENSDNSIVQNCNVQNTFRHAILVSRSDDAQVEGNIFQNFGRRRLEVSLGAPVQAGVTSILSARTVFNKNHLYNGNGEGIGFYKGSTDGEATQNRIEGLRIGIYVHLSSGHDILNNVVVNTVGAPAYNNCNGIVVAEEPDTIAQTGDLDNITIAGNIVVNYTLGLGLIQANTAADFTNIRILSNIFIGNDDTMKCRNVYNTSVAGTMIKGNISWPLNAHVATLSGDWTGATWGQNMWSPVPSYLQSTVVHVGDVRAAPVFSTPGQFQNVSLGEFEIQMVAFSQGSPGIGTGVDNSTYITQLFHSSDTSPFTASLSTPSTPWDFGAVDYGGSISAETNCNNGIDDDLDGFTDCDDSDCINDAACVVIEENCNNGLDDDNDGDVDCADSGCYAEVYCEQPESTCDDGIDNDGDGRIDCYSGLEDSDCSCTPPAAGNSNQPHIKGGRWY